MGQNNREHPTSSKVNESLIQSETTDISFFGIARAISDDKRVAAIPNLDLSNVTVGGQYGHNLRYRDSTGQSVTIRPVIEREISINGHVAPRLYAGDGSILSKPRIPRYGDYDDIPIEITGDRAMFQSESVFKKYAVDIVSNDDVIASTAERTFGIGYPNELRRNGETGEVKVTYPRIDEVKNSWAVIFEIITYASDGTITSEFSKEFTHQGSQFVTTYDTSAITSVPDGGNRDYDVSFYVDGSPSIGGRNLWAGGSFVSSRPETTEGENDSDADNEQSTNADDTVAFEVTLDDISACGQTCRELTLSLTNTGTAPAESVTVDVTLSTGGSIIWAGSANVGRLGPEESHRESEEVRLSYEDGLRVRRNDNVVTARMFIRTNKNEFILTKTVDVNTLEPADPPLPDLQSGSEKVVRFDGKNFYLIDEIPDQPPNRIAVTTNEYELIPVRQVRSVVRRDLWPQLRWDIDWRDEITRTQEFRQDQAANKAFGRALDLGWDITEILIFVSTGFPQASTGAVLDAATDTISWAVQDVRRPYREAFQGMTASLSNSDDISGLAEQATSQNEFVEWLQRYINSVLLYKDLVEEGAVLASAWSQVYSSGLSSGATTASSTALSKSKGFFVGFAVSTATGIMESAIKSKSKIHGVGHAFATLRLPILHRLNALEKNLTVDGYRFGDGIEYYIHLQKNYQMYALAYAIIAKYWRQISEANIGGILQTGTIWDILVDAQEKEQRARQKSQNMADTARTTALILGQTIDNIKTRTRQSINAEFTVNQSGNRNSSTISSDWP